MYANEIRNSISEYLQDDKMQYAIMIDGAWGSGKTYFLKHTLLNIISEADIGKSKMRKHAYISLYGLNSVDEIAKEIIMNFFGSKNNKKVKVADLLLETTSSVITTSIRAINIDFSKLKNLLTSVDIHNWILCFDDLERCSIPMNEVLGFINGLVEHNDCKVIILANQEEIGKFNINSNLENKYQVILNGKGLDFTEGNKKDLKNDNSISISDLKYKTNMLFKENFFYDSIKEKLVGLTLRFEPDMNEVFESIIKKFNSAFGYKEYLEEHEELILKAFQKEECTNIRTVLYMFSKFESIYINMQRHYATMKYRDKILEEFLLYIIKLSVFYRNGGKVADLKLTTEIGYVKFPHDNLAITKAFKVIEQYCVYGNLNIDIFKHTVSIVNKEKQTEENNISKLKINEGQAYGRLSRWWELEDEEVDELVNQLEHEIEENKYTYQSYQGIIADLLILKKNGFYQRDINLIVDLMNKNIEEETELIDIDRYSYPFSDDIVTQKEYNGYIDKLTRKVNDIKGFVKANEVSIILKKDNWSEELERYCKENYKEFISRYGFIDLLDLNYLYNRLENANPKEIYRIRDVFKSVYYISNANEFFSNDLEDIKSFLIKCQKFSVPSKNRTRAKESLEEYLNIVIKKLQMDNEFE